MFSVSLRIVNNAIEAEDIMQESFLSVFRNLNSYRGEVSFGAWMKKIVINRSLDYLKKKKVKFEEISEKTNRIADFNMGFDEVNIEAIKKAISCLPDNYRVVLSLFLMEGFNHDQISKSLGISNESSRVLLLRAKNKLKELLKGKDIYMYN